MRFLLDENIDLRLGDVLAARGHDVTSITRDYTPGMSDEDVLAVAFQEDRYVITSDRGFGDLVFVHRRPHAGVILFRLRDDWLSTKVARLLAVLDTVGIPPRKFVVITHEHIRIRSTELE